MAVGVFSPLGIRDWMDESSEIDLAMLLLFSFKSDRLRSSLLTICCLMHFGVWTAERVFAAWRRPIATPPPEGLLYLDVLLIILGGARFRKAAPPPRRRLGVRVHPRPSSVSDFEKRLSSVFIFPCAGRAFFFEMYYRE